MSSPLVVFFLLTYVHQTPPEARNKIHIFMFLCFFCNITAKVIQPVTRDLNRFRLRTISIFVEILLLLRFEHASNISDFKIPAKTIIEAKDLYMMKLKIFHISIQKGIVWGKFLPSPFARATWVNATPKELQKIFMQRIDTDRKLSNYCPQQISWYTWRLQTSLFDWFSRKTRRQNNLLFHIFQHPINLLANTILQVCVQLTYIYFVSNLPKCL